MAWKDVGQREGVKCGVKLVTVSAKDSTELIVLPVGSPVS